MLGGKNLKTCLAAKICRKLALHSRIIFATPKVVHRPTIREDSPQGYDPKNIYQIRTKKYMLALGNCFP